MIPPWTTLGYPNDPHPARQKNGSKWGRSFVRLEVSEKKWMEKTTGDAVKTGDAIGKY